MPFRTFTIVAIAAVFLVAGAAGLRMYSGQFNYPSADITTHEQPSYTSTPEAAATETETSDEQTTTLDNQIFGTDTDTGFPSLTYQGSQLITSYRFQFDKNCHATAGLPMQGSLNVKQGSLIVLENHGEATHELAIGTQAYDVKAGGFTIAEAPAVETNTGFLVTCDGKGAGRLYVYP